MLPWSRPATALGLYLEKISQIPFLLRPAQGRRLPLPGPRPHGRGVVAEQIASLVGQSATPTGKVVKVNAGPGNLRPKQRPAPPPDVRRVSRGVRGGGTTSREAVSGSNCARRCCARRSRDVSGNPGTELQPWVRVVACCSPPSPRPQRCSKGEASGQQGRTSPVIQELHAKIAGQFGTSTRPDGCINKVNHGESSVGSRASLIPTASASSGFACCSIPASLSGIGGAVPRPRAFSHAIHASQFRAGDRHRRGGSALRVRWLTVSGRRPLIVARRFAWCSRCRYPSRQPVNGGLSCCSAWTECSAVLTGRWRAARDDARLRVARGGSA